jgi:Pvc16 N-terminal domain/Carboxypeptidase regulatory-like domain
MIRDLSETLRRLLTQPALPPELATAQIEFDHPTERFNPPQTTVDLFLYDIRENVELRSNEPLIEHRNGQAVLHRPPLRVACSYLVTAWPVGGEEVVLQEHRLLSQVLQVLSQYPTIPEPFLQGSLVGQEPPLPMVTALVDPQKNLSEFWTALGNRLRPSLTVIVTIGMPVFADVTGPLVTTQITGFDVGKGMVEETLVQIGGRVLDAAGHGIAGARVCIVNTGLQATTNTEGRYAFTRIPVGTYTVRVGAVGFMPKTQPLVVPGRPEDYDVALTPL